ncbi:DUF4232 domain-containing protein [Streptomyces sp. CA-111067]|uniref:DUF4232 domain-containing protein n=1 Tax=Streptomyces sp. CA-111067 TaxID=3240046 RepID=UPI003D98C175
MKSALSSAAVLLVSAAALTACQPDSAASASSSTPSRQAGAASSPADTTAPAPPPSTTASPPDGTASQVSSTSSTSSSGKAGPSSAKPAPAKPSPAKPAPAPRSRYATSDSYAWKHPCSSKQISVHLVRRASAPTQRVIEVRNNGARSCGLSYYPHVVLWNADSATGGVTITPLVPDGLGGPPASPVYAGRTAYAVVDLDPSGATKGTAFGVNEMNVLADGDHMSSRETVQFPLGAGAHVLKPKLGLYEDTVARAVASMESADIQP